ncbi:MAG TPA: alkaline phosphatase family protein [Actinomycetota bacterium]|jgi:predicted AlkP superfamily phosphohydrolase/phosphomutase
MSRALIVGWDGADWRILDPMLERGSLPNLASLIGRGGRAVLKSTIPTHSWAAWPSFLTGVDPADHGVYDILEIRRGTRRQFPVTYRSMKERTFLDDLTAAGAETVMVNVPLTAPPPAISGRLVAGGVLPKGRPFTHPDSLAGDLERAGAPFPINGMSWTTFRGRPEPFLDEAVELTRARQRATEFLLDESDWRVACAVFVATDRMQHCLSQYISSDHPDYLRRSKEPLAAKIEDVYRLLDEGLGRLVERTGPEDVVLFMSDHGMQSCTGAVNMDRLLERLGYLEFSASNAIFGPMQWGPMRQAARKIYDRLGLHGKVSLPQPVNWAKTRAYTSIRSTGEGVNVNVAGRDHDGIVAPADADRVRDELAERLAEFVDPRTGQHPIARVWRREEVFKGRFADDGPDLLLEPSPLYSLTHARSAVERADWVSGDHRMDGVLVAAGPAVDTDGFPDTARLVDLAPTILAAAGVPASGRHTGTVLRAVVGEAAAATAAAVPGLGPASGAEDSPVGFDASEAEEVEEHLRGLGYIE